MSKVHIIKGQGPISHGEFSHILDDLGLLDKLRQAKTICIKPNLAAGGLYIGNSGVVVSREMVENLLDCIRSINTTAEIIIAESDSTGCGYAYLKFEKQNYGPLICKYAPLRLVDLSREQLERIVIDGYYFEYLNIGQSVLLSDFFISIAKMKTHNMTTITGAVKNLFGCLPDTDKSHYHNQIDKVVADLASAIRVDLAIVDGNPGLEGNGPVRGTPKFLNRIIIGNEAISTDMVMAEVMGIDCQKVRHLRLASAKKGSAQDISEVVVFGVPINEAKVNVQHIGCVQQGIVSAGIFVQRVGKFLYILGHNIHFQDSLKSVARVFIVTVFSSLLPQGVYQALKRKVKSWISKR